METACKILVFVFELPTQESNKVFLLGIQKKRDL